MMGPELDRLEAGQPLIYSGNRVATVPPELAERFVAGDRILVDSSTGEVLHIPSTVSDTVGRAVDSAVAAWGRLGACTDDQISAFFQGFADRLQADASFAPIAAANSADVADARQRGRSVTRLVLDERMRAAMVEGLSSWAATDTTRDAKLGEWVHREWSVSSYRAPLGVVGFVFEGRPNVFGDAAGVLRTGNTAVFRIGSDALGTAQAIMANAVRPALIDSGLPDGALELVNSAQRSAGWALFSDSRIGLAVARGSGPAVSQLGTVARQHGLACSLHGTGGAWLIVDRSADPGRIRSVIAASLDRKVCNTLNTVVVLSECPDAAIAAMLDGLDDAAGALGSNARVHLTAPARRRIGAIANGRLDRSIEVHRAGGVAVEPFATEIDEADLGQEWEWEGSPEISVCVVDTIEEAAQMFNAHSPRFVVSVLTGDPDAIEQAYQLCDAPFVGNGMTRWVDGQFALNTPELGLSNWQQGRVLGRGGILSGDGIYTVRYRSDISGDLRR